MYITPMEIPKCCNKCPFGHCSYSFPYAGNSTSMIDRKKNKKGTYGYVCDVDFWNNGKYTKILRADIGQDIPKPEWCGLKEVEKCTLD